MVEHNPTKKTMYIFQRRMLRSGFELGFLCPNHWTMGAVSVDLLKNNQEEDP